MDASSSHLIFNHGSKFHTSTNFEDLAVISSIFRAHDYRVEIGVLEAHIHMSAPHHNRRYSELTIQISKRAWNIKVTVIQGNLGAADFDMMRLRT